MLENTDSRESPSDQSNETKKLSPVELSRRRNTLFSFLHAALKAQPESAIKRVDDSLNRRSYMLRQALETTVIDQNGLEDVLLGALFFDTPFDRNPSAIARQRQKIQEFIKFFVAADQQQLLEKPHVTSRNYGFSRKLRLALVGLASLVSLHILEPAPTPYEAHYAGPSLGLSIPEAEPNDTAETAQSVEWDSLITGNYSSTTDIDGYLFPPFTSLDESVDVILTSPDGNSGIDFFLEDPAGNGARSLQKIEPLIEQDPDGSAGNSKITIPVKATMFGKHLRVGLSSGTEGMQYLLAVSLKSKIPEKEPNDTRETAMQMTVDDSIEGSLEVNTTDAYSVPLLGGSIVTFTVAATESFTNPTTLQILDQNGVSIASKKATAATKLIISSPIRNDGMYTVQLVSGDSQKPTTYRLTAKTEIDMSAPQVEVSVPEYVFFSPSDTEATGEVTIKNTGTSRITAAVGDSPTSQIITPSSEATFSFTVQIPEVHTTAQTVLVHIIGPSGVEITKEYRTIPVNRDPVQGEETQLVIKGLDPSSEDISEAIENTAESIKEMFPNTVIIKAQTQTELFDELRKLITQVEGDYNIWYAGHGHTGRLMLNIREGGDEGIITPAELIAFMDSLPPDNRFPGLNMMMCQADVSALETDRLGVVGATSNKETNTYVGYEKQPDGTIKAIIIGAKAMEIAAAEHQSIDAMLKAIREAVAAERGSPYSQEPSADFTAGNSQDPALATQAHPNDPKLGSEPKTIRAVIFLPIISR